MAKSKQRVVLPPDLAAQILFQSDRTCCVCREKGKPVQIHHLDDDPSNNDLRNLAVLCFDCHRETQIRGGFDRKLDAEQVVLYRSDWHRIVATDRATSEGAREVNQDAYAADVESIISIAEIYRENKEYELLAVHYDSVGNVELRDKYIELALAEDPSDESVCYLRGWIQKRPELIPKDVIERHLAVYQGVEDAEQHGRTLLGLGRPVDAAVKYIEGINHSLQEGNWFSAAYYLREFNEKGLLDELLKAAYRKAADEGELWWQVRALQELGWDSELKALLLSNKKDVEASGNVVLQELLADAEGDLIRAKTLRKEIARSTRTAPVADDSNDA
jgi:hypothetical protein